MNSRKSKPVLSLSKALQLLGDKVYPDAETYMREFLQNAVDATRECVAVHRECSDCSGEKRRIDIWGSTDRITIRDHATGMDEDTLLDKFWAIGETTKDTEFHRSVGVIGRFGIGAYASYKVCSRVIVRTKTYQVRSFSLMTDVDFEELISGGEISCDSIPNFPGGHGTEVVAILKSTCSLESLEQYVRTYVRYCPEAIYWNNFLVSQDSFVGTIPSVATVTHEKSSVISVWFQNEKVHVQYAESTDALPTIAALIVEKGSVSLFHRRLFVEVHPDPRSSTSMSPRMLPLSGRLDLRDSKLSLDRMHYEWESLVLAARILEKCAESAYNFIRDNLPIEAVPEFVECAFRKKDPLVIKKIQVPLFRVNSMILGDIEERSQLKQFKVFVARSTEVGDDERARTLADQGNLIVLVDSLSADRKSAVENFLVNQCGASKFSEYRSPRVELPPESLKIATKKVLLRLKDALQATDNLILCPAKMDPNVLVDHERSVDPKSGSDIFRVFVNVEHGTFAEMEGCIDEPFAFQMLRASIILPHMNSILERALRASHPLAVKKKGVFRQLIDRFARVFLVRGSRGTGRYLGPSESLVDISGEFDEYRGLWIRVPDAFVALHKDQILQLVELETVWFARDVIMIGANRSSHVHMTCQLRVPWFLPLGQHLVSTQSKRARQSPAFLWDNGQIYFQFPNELRETMIQNAEADSEVQNQGSWPVASAYHIDWTVLFITEDVNVAE